MKVRESLSYLISTLLMVLFITTLFFPLCNAEAGEKKYNWKISHIRPEGTPIDTDLHAFAGRVKELSNGRIQVEVYPSNKLGDYTEVQNLISVGGIDMACQCLSTAKNKKLLIQYMPYLARNWGEAKKIFAPSSPLIKSIDDMMKKENIKVISTWPVYFGGITTSKKVENPAVLHEKKNIKLRVPDIKSFSLTIKEWGYNAMPLALAEVSTFLQAGLIDGIIGAGAEGYYSNFRDLVKYYYAVNDHFENWFLIMNDDLWESMGQEDRDIVNKAAAEMQESRFSVAEAQEQEYMQKLRDYGIEVATFTPEQIDSFAVDIRKNTWPELRKEIGDELVDSSLNSVK